MGSGVSEIAQALPYSFGFKVHHLMCLELMKFVDRISQIFQAIESARPRCSSGIQALCSLNLAMEKAKLLLQHCTESSKLYLAVTGQAIVLRCERVRNSMELSLSQIQNMVPTLLAAQISGIVDDLRDAKFIMESSEEEAGKVMLALLRQGTSASDSTETSEFEAFQIAATALHITSPKALLIEKRSIRRLLDEVHYTDQKKEDILKYLLYLLRKYGKSIGSEKAENSGAQFGSSLSSQYPACDNSIYDQCIELEPHVEFGRDDAQAGVSSILIPPKEFKCPISLKLMHDPVVIASGQSFERVWIEKWFNEGHDICPKTQKKLSHFSMTPNSAMKDLISQWCRKHGITFPDPDSQSIPTAVYSWKTSSSNSITSFGSFLNDISIQNIDVSNVSLGSSDASDGSDSSSWMNDDSHIRQSSVTCSHGLNLGLLSKLAALPWESQCKAMKDVKNYLEENEQECISSNGFVESLFRFLKDASELNDVKAQRAGAQVLLEIVNKSKRSELPSLPEDVICLLASFLDSEITKEALAIMEVLSCHRYCKSKIVASGAVTYILRILDSQSREFQAPAVKILCELSSNREITAHFLSLGCIQKLVPLLGDCSLAGHCIKILKNLCDSEEARVAVTEANGCIASVVELLEMGTHEEQEHAVAVLLTLCSQRIECCEMIMEEGVIPFLVNISVNGTTRAKVSAMELLRILRDIRLSDSMESSLPHATSNPEFSQDTGNHSKEKQSSTKAPGFFGRRMTILKTKIGSSLLSL